MKMNCKIKLMLVISIISITTLSTADSLRLRIIGRIMPRVCTVEIGNGGNIDYGAIYPEQLSKSAYTILDEKKLNFRIFCNAPLKIALKSVNLRPGTAAGVFYDGPNGGFGPSGFKLFGKLSSSVAVSGLGLDGASKIGGYAISFIPDSFVADGRKVIPISKDSINQLWFPSAFISSGGSSVRLNSWAKLGPMTPIAVAKLSGEIGIHTYINHASRLNISRPINMSGMTSLELIYL